MWGMLHKMMCAVITRINILAMSTRGTVVNNTSAAKQFLFPPKNMQNRVKYYICMS